MRGVRGVRATVLARGILALTLGGAAALKLRDVAVGWALGPFEWAALVAWPTSISELHERQLHVCVCEGGFRGALPHMR